MCAGQIQPRASLVPHAVRQLRVERVDFQPRVAGFAAGEEGSEFASIQTQTFGQLASVCTWNGCAETFDRREDLLA